MNNDKTFSFSDGTKSEDYPDNTHSDDENISDVLNALKRQLILQEEAWQASETEWKKKRNMEVKTDIRSHWLRVSPMLVICCIVIGLFYEEDSKLFFVSTALITLFYISFVSAKLIFWLRTWGSYIERRIEEIEARIEDREPVHYEKKLGVTYKTHRIHQKLDAMNIKLEILSNHLPWNQLKNEALMLGRDLGYPDDDILAILDKDPINAVRWLRSEKDKKSQ